MFAAVSILAENNFGDTRSGGLAGPLAGLIVVLMALATVFLIRNMNTRLRRLPESFPAAEQGDHDTAADRQTGRQTSIRTPDETSTTITSVPISETTEK